MVAPEENEVKMREEQKLKETKVQQFKKNGKEIVYFKK
jgi:hypothetical protein